MTTPAAPGLLGRWSEAVVTPGAAMARAEAAREGGRPGVDVVKAIGLGVIAGNTRALVAAGWVAIVLGVRPAMAPLVSALTAAATVPLAVVALGAAIVWVAAGPRRELARDVDLACVAALPALLVAPVLTTAGTLVALPRPAAIAIVAAASAPALVAAVRAARRREPAP